MLNGPLALLFQVLLVHSAGLDWTEAWAAGALAPLSSGAVAHFPCRKLVGGRTGGAGRDQPPRQRPSETRKRWALCAWATSQGKSLDLPFISISFFTKEQARISLGAPICTELLCWCPLLLTHSPLPAPWGCWPPSPGTVAVPPRRLAPQAVL